MAAAQVGEWIAAQMFEIAREPSTTPRRSTDAFATDRSRAAPSTSSHTRGREAEASRSRVSDSPPSLALPRRSAAPSTRKQHLRQRLPALASRRKQQCRDERRRRHDRPCDQRCRRRRAAPPARARGAAAAGLAQLKQERGATTAATTSAAGTGDPLSVGAWFDVTMCDLDRELQRRACCVVEIGDVH
jgi:hypothetical protein